MLNAVTIEMALAFAAIDAQAIDPPLVQTGSSRAGCCTPPARDSLSSAVLSLARPSAPAIRSKESGVARATVS
jgi:hypothetical protein